MLNTPALLTVEEWPLFEEPSPELKALLEAGGYFGQAWTMRPKSPATTSYVVPANIMILSKSVFANSNHFISFRVKPALEARSGNEALDLMKLLRSNPAVFGQLHGSEGSRGRRRRNRALDDAKVLLKAILAERKERDAAIDKAARIIEAAAADALSPAVEKDGTETSPLMSMSPAGARATWNAFVDRAEEKFSEGEQDDLAEFEQSLA